MPFRPSFDYVLIKPIKRVQSRVIEVVSYEKYNRGMIVAVGPGDYPKYDDEKRRGLRNYKAAFIPTEVKPGDFVLYVDMDSVPNYYKHHIEHYADGTSEEFIIGQEKDLVGVGEREEVDPGGELSDEKIEDLLITHQRSFRLRERVGPKYKLDSFAA